VVSVGGYERMVRVNLSGVIVSNARQQGQSTDACQPPVSITSKEDFRYI
jgi:hypothetical protein